MKNPYKRHLLGCGVLTSLAWTTLFYTRERRETVPNTVAGEISTGSWNSTTTPQDWDSGSDNPWTISKLPNIRVHKFKVLSARFCWQEYVGRCVVCLIL